MGLFCLPYFLFPASFCQTDIFFQIINVSAVGSCGRKPCFLCDQRSKGVAHTVFPMYHKHPSGRFPKGLHPFQQMLLVCVSADSGQILDFCMNLNRFTKQLYLFCSVQQHISKGARYLITYEKNRGIFSPEIMFQMMANPSCLAHTGSRNNYNGLFNKINHFGFITGNSHFKSRKTNGVLPFAHQFQGLLIKTFFHIFMKNAGGLHCQRAVYVHLKILKFRQKALRFDFPQKIQHFLCSAHGKSRNHHIPSSGKCIFAHLCKFFCIIRRILMETVSIGGFHNHIIGLPNILGIAD